MIHMKEHKTYYYLKWSLMLVWVLVMLLDKYFLLWFGQTTTYSLILSLFGVLIIVLFFSPDRKKRSSYILLKNNVQEETYESVIQKLETQLPIYNLIKGILGLLAICSFYFRSDITNLSNEIVADMLFLCLLVFWWLCEVNHPVENKQFYYWTYRNMPNPKNEPRPSGEELLSIRKMLKTKYRVKYILRISLVVLMLIFEDELINILGYPLHVILFWSIFILMVFTFGLNPDGGDISKPANPPKRHFFGGFIGGN